MSRWRLGCFGGGAGGCGLGGFGGGCGGGGGRGGLRRVLGGRGWWGWGWGGRLSRCGRHNWLTVFNMMDECGKKDKTHARQFRLTIPTTLPVGCFFFISAFPLSTFLFFSDRRILDSSSRTLLVSESESSASSFFSVAVSFGFRD
jgi:hypothetical protein